MLEIDENPDTRRKCVSCHGRLESWEGLKNGLCILCDC